MSRDLKLQDYANPPLPVRGKPTTIRLGEVVADNGDGTVDVKPVLARGTKRFVPYPQNYVPAVGDQVIYADLHGDPNTPVVLAALQTQTGGRPYMHVAFADFATADADG